MDLEEFYWAMGNDVAPEQQRKIFSLKRAAGEMLHRRWMPTKCLLRTLPIGRQNNIIAGIYDGVAVITESTLVGTFYHIDYQRKYKTFVGNRKMFLPIFVGNRKMFL